MFIEHMTPPALAVAATILHRRRVAFDALRQRVEMEVGEYARARFEMHNLIQSLIDGLDEAEGDSDLEPYLAGFHQESRDDREGVAGHDDEDSEPDVWDAEVTAPETHGRGFMLNGGAAHDDAEEDDAAEDSDPSGSDQGFPDDPDGDAPESYGRGMSDRQAIAAGRERLFSPVTLGVLVSFKAGRLTQARAIGRRP